MNVRWLELQIPPPVVGLVMAVAMWGLAPFGPGLGVPDGPGLGVGSGGSAPGA